MTSTTATTTGGTTDLREFGHERWTGQRSAMTDHLGADGDGPDGGGSGGVDHD